MTITIARDGTVRLLHSDTLTPVLARALGAAPAIARASNIEFNNPAQKWEVTVAGRVLFAHADRQACLDWEHANDRQIIALTVAAGAPDAAGAIASVA